MLKYAEEPYVATDTLEQLLQNQAELQEDFKDFTAGEIGQRLEKYLVRPDGKTDEEFDEWVQTVIVVGLKSSLLKHHITLVDLPGTSKTDSEAVQRHLKATLHALRPSGVMMLYPNTSFADDEIESYRFLQSTLALDHVGHVLEMFFVNSRVS